MAKKKITRKELLKGEDEFISLSARASQYILVHAKTIKYLLYGLAIIVIILLSGSLYYKHLNKKALAAYNTAYKALVGDSSPETSEKELQKSIEELDTLIKDYGWTKMATLAIPQLAYLKFDQGKYDEAISLYQTYLEKEKSDTIYRSMAYFGLAATYEAKGEYQSAINVLEQVAKGKNDFLKEETLFSLGRMYELSGQTKRSQEVFKEFIGQFKDSPLLPLAKAHVKE
jgi:predicted negative regulator of RcsB-dependent stress response